MLSRSIEPPERSSLSGSLIIAVSLAAFLVAVVLPGESIWTAGFFALLLLISLLLQACLFGALHFLQGFPRGAWGFGMAFIYGIMLGHIRRKSRGMPAPWLAHVCADLVIFAILAFRVWNSVVQAKG